MKLHSLRTTLLAASIGLAVTCAGQTGAIAYTGVNLLKNGDFSHGQDNWTLDIQAPVTAAAEVVTAGPKSGSRALHLVATKVLPTSKWGSEISLNQPVAILDGKRYRLTFWAKSNAATAIAVTCKQNHAPWSHHAPESAELYPTLTNEWQLISMPFSIPADGNMLINISNLAKTAGQEFWFADFLLESD